MSTPNNRRRDPGGFGAETLMLLVGIAGVVAAIVVLNVVVRLGHQLDGTGVELPSDPFAFTLGVILGRCRGRPPRPGSSRCSWRSSSPSWCSRSSASCATGRAVPASTGPAATWAGGRTSRA